MRQGSSLGSGGAATPDRSSSEEPVYDPPDESTYYPPESPTSPTIEEPASVPEEASEVEPVAPPPAKQPPAPQAGVTSVGSAKALKQPDRLRVAGVHAESAALASKGNGSGSGPDFLWWVAIVACAVVLIYAAGRLVLEPTEVFRR